MTSRSCVAALALLLAGPALANDSTAELHTGGLILVENEFVEMASEDLYISTEEVRVTYEFRNAGDTDRTVLVAFPMPDMKGDPFVPISFPSEESENLFDFSTRVNGEPVDATLYQTVSAAGIDRTALLTRLGVPLLPFSAATADAMNTLPEADRDQLVHLGLAFREQFDAGDGWEEGLWPLWTLRATYAFEATFPAGETVTIEHRYRPSVGGTVGVTFNEPESEYSNYAAYAERYCMDEDFLAAVRATTTPENPYPPFYEQRISYILTTGANWSGPIGSFRLVVDKGAPENLVSFCGTGVRKIGPTTFEMTATDFIPEREVEILILQRQPDQLP